MLYLLVHLVHKVNSRKCLIMATGGIAGEELCGFELFECSVCLESLINKQPRLLSCGHTFCTLCLQQLCGGNTVNCPKCRSPTQLPAGGVQALPKNTDISKMIEREQELSLRNKYFCQMCKKKDAKVEFFCVACPKGQACQACYNKHTRIPSLKTHQIFPIEKKIDTEKKCEKCKDHGELLEHFCKQCEEPICVTCICDGQHEEHCDQIVDFSTGLQGVKACMNKLHEEFKDHAKNVEVCAKILKQNIDLLEEQMEVLSAKCQDVETILRQLKQQLELITELHQPLRESHIGIISHLADVTRQITEIDNLQQNSDVNCMRKLKDCRRNCDLAMNDKEKLFNRTIKLPESIKQNIQIMGDVGDVKINELNLKERLISKPQHGTDIALTEKEPEPELVPRSSSRHSVQRQDYELNNLNLLSEIRPGGTVDMRNPLEVVSVGDGTVILVDKELNYLQRINTEGNVVRKYYVLLNKGVYYRSACVHGNHLFVATSDKVITKMSLDGSGCNIEYKPEGVRTISYISAIGDNVILISGCEWDCRILEYNTETNQVIQRVSNTLCLGKVSVVQASDYTKYMYIVTCILSNLVVNIYNRHWNLISTIDMFPYALTVTPGGKLLLVRDNRIYEYSQDGRLIRELLDKYKFHNIKDMTYSGGCLWVLESKPHCIKIFQLS